MGENHQGQKDPSKQINNVLRRWFEFMAHSHWIKLYHFCSGGGRKFVSGSAISNTCDQIPLAWLGGAEVRGLGGGSRWGSVWEQGERRSHKPHNHRMSPSVNDLTVKVKLEGICGSVSMTQIEKSVRCVGPDILQSSHDWSQHQTE